MGPFPPFTGQVIWPSTVLEWQPRINANAREWNADLSLAPGDASASGLPHVPPPLLIYSRPFASIRGSSSKWRSLESAGLISQNS